MTTPWTMPSVFYQYPELEAENIHTSWNNTNDNLIISHSRKFHTTTNLYHISRSPKHDYLNKTYFIRFTGFNFSSVPNTISGIECKLTSRRLGRATDDTVQLCLNNELIGENKANLIIHPSKIYGDETDLWATSNLQPTSILNSSFGIVIRFQAHPKWPHQSSVFIDSVELRIH